MRAKKSFGQHFLVNAGAADGIVGAAGVGAGDRVVEIGPGHGVLTERLLRTGAEVTAIEADADLETVLRSRYPQLDLRMADATRFDLASLGEGPITFVSNLPYNVSKPLLTKFYHERRRFPRWVLMLQREVADRLLAKPSTKDWGPLSILFQNAFAIKRVMELSPGSFRPPPKVHSTVLQFDLREQALHDLGDADKFARMLFDVFQERRKTIANRFKALNVPPEVLTNHGLTGKERVEILPLERVVPLVREMVESR